MIPYFLTLLLINMALTSSVAAASVASKTGYPRFCLKAAQDAALFSKFRSHQMCRLIVENVSYNEGLEFEAIINMEYKGIVPNLDKIIAEDVVGAPTKHDYKSLGICSPVVLRYIKIVGDLHDEFGDLSSLRIVEIGPGFGGQCKVLHDTFGFAEYTLIDLPECTPLIARYLSHFNINNVRTLNSSSISTPQQYDLVISNYAISEIDRVEQLNYINNIISLAPRGYITYNLQPGANPFSLQEFVTILSKSHKNIYVEAECPATGNDNFVIIWHP